MEHRPKIAIVDDEPDFRAAVSTLLEDNGFEPVALESGRQFFEHRPEVDLALIDLKLRGESGLNLARDIRASSSLPIVMLTGVGDEVDKIIGLETGADDYIMKPFNPRELIARIRAVLRRYGLADRNEIAPFPGQRHVMCFGDLSLDTERKSLQRADGDEISLTNAEYRILDFFANNPNRVITRKELLEALGSDLSKFMDRTIDVMILRLRRKIEVTPSKPEHLQTRRGRGYIFVVLEDAKSP